MADKPTDDQPTPEAPKPDTSSQEIRPAMSEQEIRDAGLVVDVPYESGSADPQRLRYGKNKGSKATEQPPEQK